MKRVTIIVILLLNAFASISTEQTPDLLIYNSDTIYIDIFPLEILAEKDSNIAKKLIDTNCISSDCWRQHIATWKIENDSLFLTGWVDCCNYQNQKLDQVFEASEIKNGKVFAFWYSDKLKKGFGDNLGWSEEKWDFKYEKHIELEINEGHIKSLKIEQQLE